jgi:hypothetical protein
MHQFLKRLNGNAFEGLSVDGYVQDMQGWVQAGFDETLDAVAEHLQSTKDIVAFEVGTWKGASADKIASRLKPNLASLVCIDTWLGAPEFYTTFIDEPCRFSNNHVHGWPQVYHTFVKNMKARGHDDVVAPFPISSVQAAEVLKYYGIRAHVIYVDASHEYDAVLADLEAYKDLVREGGILWGDDYGHELFPGLAKAVDEFAAKYGYRVETRGINWMIKV